VIPFPGESVTIEDAADITTGTNDYSLYDDMVHRAGSRTLDAGDSWRLLCYSADMDYLEETGLDCTVRWVVEVLSGTVTLTASEGIDPGYGNYRMSLPTALGSHTVTGPATLKIDSHLTPDQVLDDTGSVDSAFILGLVATSGSAVVQQVKLEVWPAAGAPGGFVDQVGFDTSPVAPSAREGGVTSSGHGTSGDIAASWDAAVAAVVADGDPNGPHPFTNIGTGGTVAHFATTPGHFQANQAIITDIDTSAAVAATMTLLTGVDWRTRSHVGPGVTVPDYTRPPTEVRDEHADYLYPQTGTGSTQWVHASAVVVQTGLEKSLGDTTVASEAFDTVTITGSGSTVSVDVDLIDGGTTLTAPGDGAVTSTTVPLTTAGRYILVHGSHTAALTAPAYPGTPATVLGGPSVGVEFVMHFGDGDPTSGTFQPIKSYASMPPYRVWSPTAVVAVVTKVRQFHRDDGLGVTPPRAFGGASRIRTGRAYGYD